MILYKNIIAEKICIIIINYVYIKLLNKHMHRIINNLEMITYFDINLEAVI
jgi:hypothetical protein